MEGKVGLPRPSSVVSRVSAQVVPSEVGRLPMETQTMGGVGSLGLNRKPGRCTHSRARLSVSYLSLVALQMLKILVGGGRWLSE